MRLVLGISTVLGVIGVAAAFGLFYLGERVFHFDHAHVQTLMYLKLSVAGHLTIFLTRTRGPFWSIRPSRILWMAVLGTQIVATLIAVYGLFMTPLGWRWASFVWGYAILCALAADRVKLLAYKILDPIKAESSQEAKAETNSYAKAVSKPEAEAVSKAEGKADPNPTANAESKAANFEAKPETTSSPDLTPQIAKRAYELYEERTRKSDRADQDWEKAEREIQKDAGQTEPNSEPKPEGKSKPKVEFKAEAKPETKSEPKTGAGTETTPELNADSKPEAKAATSVEAKLEPEPEPKADPKPEAKVEPKPKDKFEPAVDLNLHIVKRVHELYEELGREDVREVEEWEKTERDTREHEPRK